MRRHVSESPHQAGASRQKAGILEATHNVQDAGLTNDIVWDGGISHSGWFTGLMGAEDATELETTKSHTPGIHQ
jgi:hypothetical protein